MGTTAHDCPRLAAMRTAVGDVRIGLSGWRYASWRGPFYPAGLAQRRELEFASRAFGTLEINAPIIGNLGRDQASVFQMIEQGTGEVAGMTAAITGGV